MTPVLAEHLAWNNPILFHTVTVVIGVIWIRCYRFLINSRKKNMINYDKN